MIAPTGLCCVFFWLCVNEMCAIPEEDLLINDEGDDIEMRVAKAEKKATHEIKPIETVRVVYGDEADVDMDVSLIPFPAVQPPPPTEPPPKFEVSTLRRKKVKAPKTFAMGHASALRCVIFFFVLFCPFGGQKDVGSGCGWRLFASVLACWRGCVLACVIACLVCDNARACDHHARDLKLLSRHQ